MNEDEGIELLKKINKYKKDDNLIVFNVFYLKEIKNKYPKVIGYNTELKEKRCFGEFSEIRFEEDVCWKMTRMKNKSTIVQFENRFVQANLSWPIFSVDRWSELCMGDKNENNG